MFAHIMRADGSTLYSLSVAPPSAQQEIIVDGRELIVKMSPNGIRIFLHLVNVIRLTYIRRAINRC